jgi:hypothetical protein
MPFSFNPNQQQGAQPQGGMAPPGSSNEPVPESDPNSPILLLRDRSKPPTVMAYIQIMLIIVTIFMVLASAITFAYSMYLKSEVDSVKGDLEARNSEIKEYPYEDMKKLSRRFVALDGILKDYVSARSPLRFLESVVENQVYFDSFSLNRQGAGYTVSFDVVTGNYKALIQQLDSINLKNYSKVIPTPKTGSLIDGQATFKVRVTTPVFVQGLLPDQVVFVDQGSSTTTQSQSNKP